MKALSGYAEYFWLMAMNWKDVENRGWSLFKYFKRSDLPVRIYLHASKQASSADDIASIRSKLNNRQLEEFGAVDWEKYRGRIIGEITIVDEIEYGEIGHKATRSKWFFGRYGFVVEKGLLYDNPVPCRGQLGFFPVELQGLSQ